MEWVVGIYLAVGLFKALGKVVADAPDKPLWMHSERNPLVWSLYFLAYVLVWPIARG